MADRPVVRCLIARKLANGDFGRSRIVPLSVGLLAFKAGSFYVVGPDPEDMEKLAKWEREQQPFNPPRTL